MTISEIMGSPPVAIPAKELERRRKISEAMKGERHPLWGTHPSEETRRKLIKSHQGKHHTEETRKKMSEAHTGKPRSEEHRRNLSKAMKGKPQLWRRHAEIKTCKICGKRCSKGSKTGYCGEHKYQSPEWRKKNTDGARKRSQSPKWRKNQREAMQKLHQDTEYQKNHAEATLQPEYWERVRAGLNAKPSKPEKAVIDYIEDHGLPFIYTGDYNPDHMIIHPVQGGKFPDFTSEDGKIVIEVGTVWHDHEKVRKVTNGQKTIKEKNTLQGMIKFYADLGIHCIIITEKQARDANWLDRTFAVLGAAQEVSM